jgi:hypothetical protein
MQLTSGAGHSAAHAPFTQKIPVGHALPHAPQLDGSVCTSTQEGGVPHATCDSGHEGRHEALAQIWPDGQAWLPASSLHPPQLRASFCTSTQAAPHCVSAPQESAQVLRAQTCPERHATPHAPQFDGSLATSTHCPAHVVTPSASQLTAPSGLDTCADSEPISGTAPSLLGPAGSFPDEHAGESARTHRKQSGAW